MSHTFPNLQAHPTLTPNPTFQPLPLPLHMTQPPSSQELVPQPAPPIGSVAVSHQSPMHFLPPPQHYHTAPLPLNANPNHTPDYTPNSLNGSHPPPLTHENDITTSTSNDESTERESGASSHTANGTNSINTSNTAASTKAAMDGRGEKNHSDPEEGDGDEDIDMTASNNTNNNGDDTTDTRNTTAVETPFGLNYNDTTSPHNCNQPQIQQTMHAFSSPFTMQTHTPHDDRKHSTKGQYFATNLVPSPFTMHSGVDAPTLMPHTNNYEYHDTHSEKPRNILLIPPNQPMFGHHHNAYAMRPDSYLSRNYGEAQQMVDVPHVQPQIGVESDDVLAEILHVDHETNDANDNEDAEEEERDHNGANEEEHDANEEENDNETQRRNVKRRERMKKKRKLRKRKKDRNRTRERERERERDREREQMASKYESIKEQAHGANANIEGSVKGGAGNGYRMVLDEPVNKSMLSCHQCKNKKTLDRIIVCGHVYRINNTVKTCTKKYCKSCLLRFYLEAPPTDNQDPTWSSWKCPCCRYICCCAWCRKKKAKRLESVSNAIRAEAHRLTPAISLARKLVSESRVNNSNASNSNSNDNSNSKKKRHNDIPPQI